MLAVCNLQREIRGVAAQSWELVVNHKFNIPAPRNLEALILDTIQYIKEHENPMTLKTEIMVNS